MIKKFILGATLALVFTGEGCNWKSNSTVQPSPQPQMTEQRSSSRAQDEKDAYAVYDALLGRPADNANAPAGSIAIAELTELRELCFDPATERDERLREAGKDFIDQSSRQRHLQAGRFNLGQEVELISSRGLDEIFSQGVFQGWEKFHKSFPDARGYVSLSIVGFNAERDFAIVYSGMHCGPKCGAGGLTTLSEKDGVWRTNKERLCSWIS